LRRRNYDDSVRWISTSGKLTAAFEESGYETAKPIETKKPALNEPLVGLVYEIKRQSR